MIYNFDQFDQLIKRRSNRVMTISDVSWRRIFLKSSKYICLKILLIQDLLYDQNTLINPTWYPFISLLCQLICKKNYLWYQNAYQINFITSNLTFSVKTIFLLYTDFVMYITHIVYHHLPYKSFGILKRTSNSLTRLPFVISFLLSYQSESKTC